MDLMNKLPQSSFVVAGISTDVGKTVVSALLVAQLKCLYWKPIQTGVETDTSTLKALTRLPEHHFINEAYHFQRPCSPHSAAADEGAVIDLETLRLPSTDKQVLVELAGGLMTPCNNTETNLDLIIKWKLPVVLVSRHYLGSINHTLLSLLALQQAGANLAGLVFVGHPDADTETRILSVTPNTPWIRVPLSDAQPNYQWIQTLIKS